MFERYLNKIGLSASVACDETGLNDLHQAQVFSIPFENLSVLLEQPIHLDLESLISKLVERQRGGYCFELNGLFTWALNKVGFACETRLARVQFRNPTPGTRTHQISIVTVNGKKYFCDVGFGGPGLRRPMPFEFDRIEIQSGDEYRLRRDSEFGVAFEGKTSNGWLTLYVFAEEKTLPVDIVMANHFTSTFSESVFKSNLMAALTAENNRHTLMNNEYAFVSATQRDPQQWNTSDQVIAGLRSKFGIYLDAEEQQKLSSVLQKILIKN